MGEVFARVSEHFRRAIEPHNVCAGSGDFVRELAGAAAEIENLFAGLRVEKLEEAGAEAPDEGVPVLVTGGIPVGCGGNAHAFLLRAVFFADLAGGSDSAGGSSPSAAAEAGAAAARTSLKSSAFFKSFLDGGACSCR